MYQRPNLFHAVKAAVTTRQLAELYGLRPDRRGMVCCPFHGDKHPSMKVDTRFHCFACGADGDVIDFAARLHGLSKWDAARRIAGEVGLEPSQAACGVQLPRGGSPWQRGKAPVPNPGTNPTALSKAPPSGELSSGCETERVSPELDPLRQTLAQIRQNKTQYAPKSPTEPLHPKFCEAVHTEAQAEQLLAELSRMTPRQQRVWKMSHPEEVKRFGFAAEQKL